MIHAVVTGIDISGVVDRSIATFSISVYTIYPILVSRLAYSLKCTEIEGESRLLYDLQQECGKGNHLRLFWMVSIPSLVIWVLLVPAIAFWKLKKNKALVRMMTLKTESKDD